MERRLIKMATNTDILQQTKKKNHINNQFREIVISKAS